MKNGREVNLLTLFGDKGQLLFITFNIIGRLQQELLKLAVDLIRQRVAVGQ